MAILICKANPVFGIPDKVLPIKAPFIFERVRFRFRQDDFAYAFFKTASGIRQFHVEKACNGFWTIGEEQARNERR